MIINDVYLKEAVAAYKNGIEMGNWLDIDPVDDPDNAFKNRRLGAQLIYDFMFEKQLMQQNAIWSDEFVSDENGVSLEFSIDTEHLEPYKDELLNSSNPYIAKVAADYFWPTGRKPRGCLYCGAVTIASPMRTYREDWDGGVSRSWECSFCYYISSKTLNEVEESYRLKGEHEAQKVIYDILFKRNGDGEA